MYICTVHTCTHAHTYPHECLHTCHMYTFIHTTHLQCIYANNMHTSPHTCTHMCTDTRSYTCTHVQAKTYNIHSHTHRYHFWVPTLYKIYTFTTDHRLEVHRKNSLCIHALIKHLLSTYYVPHFEEYSLKYVSWNPRREILCRTKQKLKVVQGHVSVGRPGISPRVSALDYSAIPLPVAHILFPLGDLQDLWRLVSSLFKALKVPPPLLGWDSTNSMNINQLLAVMEDVICRQNKAGQVFSDEVSQTGASLTLTLGSVQVKGES